MNPLIPLGVGIGALLIASGGGGGGSDDIPNTDDLPDPDDPSKPDVPTPEEALGEWGARTDPGVVVVLDDHEPWLLGNPHESITLASSALLAAALAGHKKKVRLTLRPGMAGGTAWGSHTHDIIIGEQGLRALSRGEAIRVWSTEAEGHKHEVQFEGAT